MSVETALVTGAGAGTGREYVRMLLADGANVLAVSLLKDELDDLVAAIDPRRMTVTTDWLVRGGIHTVVEASHPPSA